MGIRRRKELAEASLWPDIQKAALQMRRQPTEAEEHLWQELRGGKLDGYRFRRQQPVGRFITDFYCVQAGLIIEVDGSSHNGLQDGDDERDAFLVGMGLRTLRFTNEEVLSSTGRVLDSIRRAITETETSNVLPLSSEGEGVGG
jgi:very-short-patch-repair endonuclease